MSLATRLVPLLAVLALASADARGAEDPAALIEHGHYQRARAVVESRVAANPKDAEALWMLSQIRNAFGAQDEALELAQQAVDLEPKNARYHEQLGEVYGQMAGEAGAFKAMGLAKHFRKEADIALQLDPKRLDARQGLIEFYWRAPGIAGGSKDKARALIQELGTIDVIEGMLAQERIALWEKDTTRAEDLIGKALQLEGPKYKGHVAAAQLHAARRRWSEAEREAEAARSLEPDRATPYGLIALAQAHLKHWAELDSTLARAESNVPDNRSPRYQAARAMIEDGTELPRAERYLRAYLDRAPEGFAPTHAHAHWRLAQALDKEGRRPDAIAELETALRLKPDLDAAKKDLKRLKSG
jgi:tetratricopeptide (TPR) repeat protein